MDFASTKTVASRSCPGVTYVIRCMSFRRRLELLKSVREAARELEFRASGESAEDRAAAAVQSGRIEELYLEWGLDSISGLRIDGVEATPDSLMERGPEALCREIAANIRRECALSDEERKN